eukprot:11043012-Ditylum_brightwellii.AAC.1
MARVPAAHASVGVGVGVTAMQANGAQSTEQLRVRPAQLNCVRRAWRLRARVVRGVRFLN